MSLFGNVLSEIHEPDFSDESTRYDPDVTS
jgi:hypothetical protein